MSVIAIEGVDCSGKSTTATLLAAKLPAVCYPTPPKAYMTMREQIDSSASDEEHYRFYLLGIQTASREIAELKTRKSVVLDRYWATTVAYHRAMGLNASLDDFGQIVLPDCTVYLTVNADVQRERFAVRGMTAGDVRMLDKMDRIRNEYEALYSGDSGVIRIDTSELSPEAVVERITRTMPSVTSR